MSFTFKNEDGQEVRDIFSCTECIYVSTKRHFINGRTCPLCYSEGEKQSTLVKDDSMSSFEYRSILDHLEEEVEGVGASTIERIEAEFPEGDDFLDACEEAYREGELDKLTAVKGIGRQKAKNVVALGIARYKGWEGGAIEPVEAGGFTLSKA